MSDERWLPDFAVQEAHKKLDELLEMYRDGAPLWIVGEMGWTSNTQEGAKVEIRIRGEYV